jgi:hypothetical protein
MAKLSQPTSAAKSRDNSQTPLECCRTIIIVSHFGLGASHFERKDGIEGVQFDSPAAPSQGSTGQQGKAVRRWDPPTALLFAGTQYKISKIKLAIIAGKASSPEILSKASLWSILILRRLAGLYEGIGPVPTCHSSPRS